MILHKTMFLVIFLTLVAPKAEKEPPHFYTEISPPSSSTNSRTATTASVFPNVSHGAFLLLKENLAQGAPEEGQRREIYEEFVQTHRELFGMLGHENPLYRKIRDVLDRMLVTAGYDASKIKFDIVLDPVPSLGVFSWENHLLLSLGMLNQLKLENEESIPLEQVAAIFVHEIVHLKYKGKKEQGKDALERKIRRYVISREEERQADQEAVDLLYDAGYPPTALREFFQQVKRGYASYVEFAKVGMWGLVYDPHQADERRIAYLDRYLETHYAKEELQNGRQSQESLRTDQIQIEEKDYGFLYFLRQGKYRQALQQAQKGWQVVYILYYLKNRGVPLEEFETILREKKETVVFPGLTSLEEKEKEFLWEALLSGTDDLERFSQQLERNRSIRLKEIVLQIPSLFPKTRIQYLAPQVGHLPQEEIGYLSPLENLMPLILFYADSKLISQILQAWQGGFPEWITDFIQSLHHTCRRYELQRDNIRLNSALKFARDFFGFLASREKPYSLTGEHKIALFDLVLEFPRLLLRAELGELPLLDESTSRLFCDQYLRNEDPSKHSWDYYVRKKELLEKFDDYYDWSGGPNCYQTLLYYTHEMDPHERAILVELYSEAQGKPQFPDPFPWQAGKGDGSDSIEQYHQAQTGREDQDEYRGWRITPYQFWTTVFDDLYFKAQNSQNLETFLSYDVSAETVAHLFIKYHLFLSSLREITTPKAQRAADLLELVYEFGQLSANQSPKKIRTEIAQLPAIPERNFLIVRLLEGSKGKERLALYRALKDLLIEEDLVAVRERLNETIEKGSGISEILADLLGEGGISEVYSKHVLGMANATADQAAALAWEAYRETISLEKLSFQERVKTIEEFFPKLGIRKEETLVRQSGAKTQQEYESLLGKISLPPFRYVVGEKLWDLMDSNLPREDHRVRLEVLCRAFPEGSFYRDEKIKTILLESWLSYPDVEVVSQLQFGPNTLQNTAEAQLYHLLMLRTLNHLIYFTHHTVKSEIFTRMVRKIASSSPEEWTRFLTAEERRELVGSFFEGPENLLIKAPIELQVSLETLFAQKNLSPEDVKRYAALRSLELTRSSGTLSLPDSEDREVKYGVDISELTAMASHLSLEKLEQIFIHGVSRGIDSEALQTVLNELGYIYVPASSLSEREEREEKIIDLLLKRFYFQKLRDYFSENKLPEIPLLQRAFFALVQSLPLHRQGEVLSKFLADILAERTMSMEDAAVAFLEYLGLVYIKTGQNLVSLGNFNDLMRMKLLRLTSSITPMDPLRTFPILRREVGDEFLSSFLLGPLLGAASSQQVHLCRVNQEEQLVVSAMRPQVTHELDEQLDSVRAFVLRVQTDPQILGGKIKIPAAFVESNLKVVEEEVKKKADPAAHKAIHRQFHGKYKGGFRIAVPLDRFSTQLLTFKTQALGNPLDRIWENLDPSVKEKIKRAVLEMYLEMIFGSSRGYYHLDPHPGNILYSASDDVLSLIDFGMVGRLSQDHKRFFYALMEQLATKNIDGFIETLVAIHLYQGGALQEGGTPIENGNVVDYHLLKQEITEFFSQNSQRQESFRDSTLRLLNMVENLKLNLSDELHLLTKTLSELGWLVQGQETFIQGWLKNEIIKSKLNFLQRPSQKMSHALDKARAYIEAHRGMYRAQVIKLPSGVQVKRGDTVIGKLAEDVVIDPAQLAQQLQQVGGQAAFPLKLVEPENGGEFVQYISENQVGRFTIEMPQGDQDLASLIFGQLRKGAPPESSSSQADRTMEANL